MTASADNADPKPGTVSIWGMINSFDDDGTLRFLGRKVGRIALGERQAEPAETKTVPHPPTIADRAFAGEPVTAVFDPEVCARQDLGNIECGVEYEGRYDRQANRWTVTGPGKISKKVMTASADNADPKPGTISIWGMINSFDDDGTLRFLGRKVGRIALH
jgi:hypothetical protein